jgi:hypothetical protein
LGTGAGAGAAVVALCFVVLWCRLFAFFVFTAVVDFFSMVVVPVAGVGAGGAAWAIKPAGSASWTRQAVGTPNLFENGYV